MKNLRRSVVAAGLAVASVGLASLVTTPATAYQADCPSAWYWNSDTQTCVPPGLPKDPPNGCLNGNGTHVNGTVCVN